MSQEEFVAALAAGDEAAWERFIAEYGGLIIAVGARFGLIGSDRDDHLQTTCLHVVRSISSLRDPDRLTSWLYNIAWRVAVDWKRRHRKEVRLHDAAGVPQVRSTAQATSGGVQDLVRQEEDEQLYKAFLSLDPRCRRFVRALYLDPDRPTYAELAAREGVPLGSIGPIRARCLDRMKKEIQRVSKLRPRRLPPERNRDQGSSPRAREVTDYE